MPKTAWTEQEVLKALGDSYEDCLERTGNEVLDREQSLGWQIALVNVARRFGDEVLKKYTRCEEG